MSQAARVRTCTLLLAMLVLLGPGCAGTVATSQSLGQTHETAIGPVLVSPDGRSLYVYDADSDGVSNCSGLCAVGWPPLLAPEGAQAADGFTVIARSGGDRQWAHNGKPLYLYIRDSKPGDVTGDGVDEVWHAARP